MESVFYYETDAGAIGIAEDGHAITRLFFGHLDPFSANAALRETNLLEHAAAQLQEYLQGKRKQFDLPLSPKGTPFQLQVWDALRNIPYGETRSYKEIAQAVNRPRAFRAVGMANNRNPIAILIPCHRVIGTDGGLVGYGGGLSLKKQLLDLEGAL